MLYRFCELESTTDVSLEVGVVLCHGITVVVVILLVHNFNILPMEGIQTYS